MMVKNSLRWFPKEIKPNKSRILVFSSIYTKHNPMRFRIIDSEFLKICTDVDMWAYIPEPKEKMIMTDVLTTEGRTVDDDETHWTVECPVCGCEFEFTGFFDSGELVDCDKCKAKINVARIYFSNGDYIE